jgi:single-strand DNA-binding protein
LTDDDHNILSTQAVVPIERDLMKNDLNEFVFTGNIGTDPKFKPGNGTPATLQFCVASNKCWKKNGEIKHKTNWHKCVMFSKEAENMSKFLKKGMFVSIVSEVDYSDYTDIKGIDHKDVTSIIVHRINFLGKAEEETTKINEDMSPWE